MPSPALIVLEDGASFRVPQGTSQKRFQASDAFSFVRGNHSLKAGAEVTWCTRSP